MFSYTAVPAGGRGGEQEGGGGRGGGREGGGGGRQGVPPLELGGLGDRASKVRFADSRKPRAGPATGMDFGTDEDRKRDQREQQSAYREELERQMVEKNFKKQREREEKERYERKIEEEARNYDPFGKGGGGAPMRDQHGNVISDLRQMRNDNINRGNDPYTPRFAAPPASYSPELQLSARTGAGGNATRAANSYRDDLIGPPPVQTTAEGETSHARGGHGIFGMPKTEAEKTQADRYKSELKKQIEEKKLEEMRKKEQQRLEEEREQKILDEQRAKMQQEYELEQAKVKAKEEEARKKNEEMMRAAEEKKLELERKRREADEERQRQLREEREREQQDRLRAEQEKRGKSPPIPTLATKGQEASETEENKGDKTKSASPPVPAARTKTATPDQGSRLANTSYNRPQSSDVLNQLANMRAQLQNERRRVQTMLDDQEDEVEIYDPRQVQRPPPGPVLNSRPEIDVFETALTRNPVAVRRTPADRHHPDRQIAEEFQSLKHKGTESRKHIRARYPDEPITDSALEHQQDALIRRQEDQLRGGRDLRALDDRRDMRSSSSSQLHSNSAFVGDDVSLYDPEDVLDRFMTKQAHNRLYLEDIETEAGSPTFGVSPVGTDQISHNAN
ncbi:centrosome and spindle pole-associated protein 1-like [Elysia marginata]|uniref:Centrosome and spindle pole-associated protein 1-like n=1 Tax=Elysia marginata TaxID=1093978 RepID=A0AAV4I9N9_9GAST|nr:centrosome and spindle pole-associated protein 1-like [Elysia marginata]